MINRNNYIDERLNEQIKWYSEKSISAKKFYIVTNIVILILTLSTPILTILSDLNEIIIKAIISLFGVGAGILTGILNIFKSKENWIKYRAVSESLKREKIMYSTQSGEYKDCNSVEKLIEKCEQIMKLENDDWININSSKKEG